MNNSTNKKCGEPIEEISGHIRKIRPCFQYKPCPIHVEPIEESKLVYDVAEQKDLAFRAMWEEEFDKQFPYKIQGSPKHTELRFITREIKSFISTLLAQAKKDERATIVAKIHKIFDGFSKENLSPDRNDIISLLSSNLE